MTLFLDKFLTEYDESLTAESYIDPMGTLVIWSAFGQQIFKGRVNSISNDVRSYTVNLIHHYLIRKLSRDESITLSHQLAKIYDNTRQQNFKFACLLYLENLFTFSMLQHEDKVDTNGVLGIVKARRIWAEKEGNPVLYFTHDKRGEILVRQLGLGVNGRYKTPFMEIGYLDANYQYDRPVSVDLWQRTEQFIQKNSVLQRLVELAYNHLKEILQKPSTVSGIAFNDVPIELRQALVAAFPSSGAIGKVARPYWLEATRLDIGAAGVLLKVLDENASAKHPVDLSPKDLIARAIKKEMAEEDRTLMTYIQTLELFLAEISLLFNLLTTKKAQPLKAVIVEWQRFGRDSNTLQRLANQVTGAFGLLQALTGTARNRLQILLKIADFDHMEAQIDHLLTYHKQIMERDRHQHPWLTIKTGMVKVHVRPSKSPEHKLWKEECWVNNYYLPQFTWLVTGFQGGRK